MRAATPVVGEMVRSLEETAVVVEKREGGTGGVLWRRCTVPSL